MIWIVSILLAISIYVNVNLFRKNEKLEDANEELNAWLFSYYNSLTLILQNMRELDQKKMFESDDEVGVTFNMITDEIKKLENLFGDNTDA